MKGSIVLKKAPIIIAVGLFVAVIAFWMLDKDYATEIAVRDRTLISAGAGVLSGTIMWLFFMLDKKKE